MDNTQLQQKVDKLEKQMATLNNSSTITYQVDNAFNNRGFIKTDFFVAGTGQCNAFGEYRVVIPGVSKPDTTNNSIPLVSGFDTPVAGKLTEGYSENNFGSSSSRFDITNPSGDTFRYTWDGTGTNPGINASTLPVGSRIQIFSNNFTSSNTNTAGRPFFYVTGSGTNYFEVENTTPGVAENNVTLGSGGSITGGPTNNTSELLVQGYASAEFYFVVFLFKQLFTRI